MQVMGKGRVCFTAKMMADAAQGKVHLCKAIGGGLFFLTVYIDAADIALFRLDKVSTLNKHTTGAAAGVVQGAVKGLDHGSDQLNGIVRCIELPLLLCGIDGKLLEEIFVHTTNQVFLFAKRLMTDFVDLINHLLDVIRCKVSGGKCPLHEAATKLLAAGGNAVQCRIKRNIELRRRRVDDGRPTCLRREIIGAVRESGIIKECREDFRIIRVKPLCNQILAELCYAILKFFSDKTQKYEGQHHVTLFKERAGIACRTQNISAFEQD